MNRDLLDAFHAVAWDFYMDSLDRYPCLFLDISQEIYDEAMVVWRVLLAIDDLTPIIQAAIDFDEATKADNDRDDQQDLPF